MTGGAAALAPASAASRLLERDDALARLQRLLASSSSHGRIAAISGEAGVGKTSLVEALAAAEESRASFLWGGCEALDTPRPLGPLLDISRQLDADFRDRLASGAPRHEVFAAFTAALECPMHRSVCVVFEDVHWADEATLDLLRYLSRRIQRTCALVVLTWRADEVGADHRLQRLLGELPAASTDRIDLQPLSPEAVRQLAGDAWDAAELFALTNGNPFFVSELIRADERSVPASIRQAILARRGRLPAPARQIVDFVSVVPSRTELELVSAAIPRAQEVAAPAVEAGLLTFDGRTLGFRHELARLAVLESLPLLRVQELHRTVVAGLEPLGDRTGVPARLVHHAVGAGDGDAVRRFASAAGLQAAQLGAHREAAAHYRTALQWADTMDAAVRAEIGDRLSYECYLTGDIAAAREARIDALAIWRRLGLPRAIGRDVRWLSRLAWFLGNRAEARAHAREALDVLMPLGDDEELAMALSNSAQLHMLAHENDECIETGQRAIEMARRVGATYVLSHALNSVGCSRVYAGDLAGRRIQEESLAMALEHDQHEHAARGFTNLSSSAVHTREYEYARRWLAEGIAYSEDRDLDSWRLYMVAWRARLQLETGMWREAEADATAVMDDPHSAVIAKIPALAVLGLLHARERRADAGQLLDHALALAIPTEEAQRLVPVRAARAELALLQGRTDDAIAEAAAGLSLLKPGDLAWDWELLRYLEWCAEGRRASARAARIGTAEPVSPFVLQMRGEWRAAAEAWARIGCPYERADALSEGDVPAMQEALVEFAALGASAAADRVRQNLRRAGVHRLRRGPRPSTRAHPAGLTRRQAEILQLLARRLTNPAIAERLFVSPKTVEHHVSAILAKLDVASRDDAVIEARRRGWFDTAEHDE